MMFNLYKSVEKKMCKRVLIVSTVILLSMQSAYSQLHTRVYLSPRLKIGWTFFSGFNYGLDFTIGLFRLKAKNPEINVCISPQYMMVNYKGNVHSIVSFNAVLESDYYRLNLGIGKAVTKWGFHNRNSNNALGYNIGVALSTSSVHTPWIEGNVFALSNGYWEFYGRPYYMMTSVFFRPAEPYVVYETK